MDYSVNDLIAELAKKIFDANGNRSFALIGIRDRGDEVAKRIYELLQAKGANVDYGTLDISLYRDDFHKMEKVPKLKSSQIDFQVDEAEIILVDDVIYTGRTIRAALDAINDYGRPACIQLASLVDRGHRELPIQPDYCGLTLETSLSQKVNVFLKETDGEDKIEIIQRAN